MGRTLREIHFDKTTLLLLALATIPVPGCRESATEAVHQSDWVIYNSSNSGLPNDQVQAISIDGNDRWFGTSDGLARFVDDTWNTYDTATSPLPSPFITALETDGGHRLWIGTDRGLAMFDGTQWSVHTVASGALANNQVTAIEVDAAGRVWAGTEEGVARYDGSSWTLYNDSAGGLFADIVRSVTVDDRGIVWAGTFDPFLFQGKLWRFDGVNWSSDRLEQKGLPSGFPNAITAEPGSGMWLGVSGTTGGTLVRIQGSMWTLFDRSNSGFSGNGITSLALEDSIVWIGTGGGLVAYDRHRWTVFQMNNSELPDDYILTVVVDGKRNRWVGTAGGGVAMLRSSHAP